MSSKLTSIILAAGKSNRFGGKIPKTFLSFYGRPLFYYSLYSFNQVDEVDSIYLVVSKEMLEEAQLYKKKYFKNINKFKDIIVGGDERMHSVFNALNSIRKDTEYVALHDAARPFIKPELIRTIFYEAVKRDAAVCGIPVIDTIKMLNHNVFIETHLKREELIAIQTPQIFNYNKLYDNYKNAIAKDVVYTDDTEIFALSGDKISIVKGDKDLFKITYKDDIKIAKSIYQRIKNIWK